jgi:TATA-box binding protein (TBP) (component of TFIID and TFIIIB)
MQKTIKHTKLVYAKTYDRDFNMKKTIKIILTTAILSFICSNAVAIGMRSTSDVKKSIDQTIEKLEKAVATFDKGTDQNAVVELLMEAKQVQKSISMPHFR